MRRRHSRISLPRPAGRHRKERLRSDWHTTNEYFVEIGFDASSYEGGTGANTWQFHLDGWDGVLIDGQHENASINLHKAHAVSYTHLTLPTKRIV